MNMDIDQIRARWYASLYEQQENQTDDVEFLLAFLGGAPLNILEVCCGGGRILVPLARAGHTAVGFDRDEAMLARIPAKAAGLANLRHYRAGALDSDWGQGFDAVILAGNILINIETNGDYRQAQELFIRKAAAALKDGGLLYFDFNLFAHPERFFGSGKESTYFAGADEHGIRGRVISCSEGYDPLTQMAYSRGRIELDLPNGERDIRATRSAKHIPTLENIHGWLAAAGFAVREQYGDYERNPIGETTNRAIIAACKNPGGAITIQ